MNRWPRTRGEAFNRQGAVLYLSCLSCRDIWHSLLRVFSFASTHSGTSQGLVVKGRVRVIFVVLMSLPLKLQLLVGNLNQAAHTS